MKYMLMMNTSGGPYQIASWPAQDMKAHIAFMMKFNKKLSAAGELVTVAGLSGPDQAKRVRARAGGEPITDGVPRPRSSWRATGLWTSNHRSGPTRLRPRPRRLPGLVDRR